MGRVGVRGFLDRMNTAKHLPPQARMGMVVRASMHERPNLHDPKSLGEAPEGHGPSGTSNTSQPGPSALINRLPPGPWALIFAAMLQSLTQAGTAELPLESIPLPSLRIDGQPARAHTQGMERQAESYYVTARREDVRPKRALLLRTTPTRTDWDVWDITPLNERGEVTPLDHPGGFQSDGTRLWIPVAESKRQGRSVIRVYRISDLGPGQPAKPELEFPVQDHIGAVAVSAGQQIVLGANWDTEAVYVWDLAGRPRRKLGPPELAVRNLGAPAGLAVQDWKRVGDRLFASGLRSASASLSRSQLLVLSDFLQPEGKHEALKLPKPPLTELAREAMAVAGDWVYFLPEDLGASNRVFRAPMSALVGAGAP